MIDFQMGDTVDVTIRNVTYETESSHGIVTIRDEHGIPYTMPGQAAITPARQDDGEEEPADGDARLLQSRIDNAIASIDRMIANGEIDAGQGYWLRRTLDPYPRHWPPQPGDVWHDGLPDGFFATLWFAQVIHGTGDSWIVMVPVERHNGEPSSKTPEEWFADQSSQAVHLVYRQPNDTKPDTGMGEFDAAEDYL